MSRSTQVPTSRWSRRAQFGVPQVTLTLLALYLLASLFRLYVPGLAASMLTRGIDGMTAAALTRARDPRDHVRRRAFEMEFHIRGSQHATSTTMETIAVHLPELSYVRGFTLSHSSRG